MEVHSEYKFMLSFTIFSLAHMKTCTENILSINWVAGFSILINAP